jgi:hypothetical protein
MRYRVSGTARIYVCAEIELTEEELNKNKKAVGDNFSTSDLNDLITDMAYDYFCMIEHDGDNEYERLIGTSGRASVGILKDEEGNDIGVDFNSIEKLDDWD